MKGKKLVLKRIMSVCLMLMAGILPVMAENAVYGAGEFTPGSNAKTVYSTLATEYTAENRERNLV